jgi:DNA repair protein RadC
MASGAQSLSDAELLAVLLRTGMAGKSAVDLAHEVLHRIGGIGGLCSPRLAQARTVSGLGAAKYAQIAAMLELTQRAIAAPLIVGNALESPAAVRAYLQLQLRGREREIFVAIFLDNQHRVIACEELFKGTLAHTPVYPREVVKSALSHNAAALILAHNHPSGLAEPSAADQALTRVLREALTLVDIRLLDHFIVAGPICVGFSERGLL